MSAEAPGTGRGSAPSAGGPSPGPRVVAIGGGHGLATTLSAARRYAGELTAVVSVADDGGSSGRLRQSAGIPAPGDLRRCLVALAEEGSVWARAFEHRFGPGELEGHALGNIIIAGLAAVTGSFTEALDLAAELVGAAGRVLPATAVPVVLKADVGGRDVLGQVNVSTAGAPITAVSLVPPDAPAPPEVVAAIREADQVVLGPGSLFTSVLAACVVEDVRQALAERAGGRLYVSNLRPEVPETAGFSLADHVAALLAHGVAVDVVVAGLEASPGEALGVPVVAAPLAAPGAARHDPERLAVVLASLL